MDRARCESSRSRSSGLTSLSTSSRIRGVARTRTTVALSTKWEGRPMPLGEPEDAK